MATYAELMQQVETLKHQAEELRKAEMHEHITEIKTLMAKYGVSARDLGISATTTTRTRAPRLGAGIPKYRNPANSQQQWTGHGRKPAWVVSHVEAGGKIEDLAI
jgi:DNA-binding protein H-NS